MKHIVPAGSTARSRRLRRDATPEERITWGLLREAFADARFRRQVPILNYIVDFASHRARVVIEVDGGQHCSERDMERTRRIEGEGYRLIRFWNNEVRENPEGVWTAIAGSLQHYHPHPASPIKGEEPGGVQ